MSIPDEIQMPRVFLSHNSTDKPFVRLLAEDLRASGATIWLDEVELRVGDSLILKIADAISEADFILACLSPHSIASSWVRKELAIALTLGVNRNRVLVLPLLWGAIKISEIPVALVDQLYADFRQAADYDLALGMLLRRIQPDAEPSRILDVDAIRKDQLIEVAANPAMRGWTLDYLIGTLATRCDATHRYWTYVALGQIGGERAANEVAKGLSDPNAFARRGALAATDILRTSSANSSTIGGATPLHRKG